MVLCLLLLNSKCIKVFVEGKKGRKKKKEMHSLIVQLKTVSGRGGVKQVVMSCIDSSFERFDNASQGWSSRGSYLTFFFPGFPHTLICSLNNTSLVPMTFKLRVPGDGDGHKSISSCDQYSDYKRPSGNKDEIPIMKPKEFTITPSSGTIRPQGFAAIRVKCTAF